MFFPSIWVRKQEQGSWFICRSVYTRVYMLLQSADMRECEFWRQNWQLLTNELEDAASSLSDSWCWVHQVVTEHSEVERPARQQESRRYVLQRTQPVCQCSIHRNQPTVSKHVNPLHITINIRIQKNGSCLTMWEINLMRYELTFTRWTESRSNPSAK